MAAGSSLQCLFKGQTDEHGAPQKDGLGDDVAAVVQREFEETRELMGDNYWPYGIEPNRKTLETLFRYSYEQGLASRELTIEELFHPAALELTEKSG